MYEWSEEQLMVRDAVRQFIDKEIRPRVDDLEHGDMPPYDILRKMLATFGMDTWRGTGSSVRSNSTIRRRGAERGEASPQKPAATARWR